MNHWTSICLCVCVHRSIYVLQCALWKHEYDDILFTWIATQNGYVSHDMKYMQLISLLNNSLKKCPDDEPFQFFVYSSYSHLCHYLKGYGHTTTPYVHTLFIVTLIQDSFFFLVCCWWFKRFPYIHVCTHAGNRQVSVWINVQKRKWK